MKHTHTKKLLWKHIKIPWHISFTLTLWLEGNRESNWSPGTSEASCKVAKPQHGVCHHHRLPHGMTELGWQWQLPALPLLQIGTVTSIPEYFVFQVKGEVWLGMLISGRSWVWFHTRAHTRAVQCAVINTVWSPTQGFTVLKGILIFQPLTSLLSGPTKIVG